MTFIERNPLGLPVLNEREALSNLLDALSIAENAARQLAVLTERRQWIIVSSNFGDMRELCSKLGRASFAGPPSA